MNYDDELETDPDLLRVIEKIANAITPAGAAAGQDATGGYVGSLAEAVMGIAAGLVRVAEAIGDLAQAVREA